MKGPWRGLPGPGFFHCEPPRHTALVLQCIWFEMWNPIPLSQLQIKTDVKYWHALAAFSGQPKPCQQMILSRFQSQFSLPSSDDLTLTRFTLTDLASVHWCVREENVAPSFKPKSPKTKQKVTSRFLLPVLPCSLSPDIPSVAQLPVCEKYLVEI